MLHIISLLGVHRRSTVVDQKLHNLDSPIIRKSLALALALRRTGDLPIQSRVSFIFETEFNLLSKDSFFPVARLDR